MVQTAIHGVCIYVRFVDWKILFMEKKLQYEYLKRFVDNYRTRKTYDPMMLRVFDILLADLEADVITQIKKGKL
jgi:predicted tellurium resistance membrane protein TerC